MDGVHVLVAAQERRQARRVQAARHADGPQHGEVPDVVPVGEVRREHRLHHLPPAAIPRGPAHQAVGVHAAGGAADAVEAELQPLGSTDLGDGGIQAPRPLLPAELADDVIRPGHAGARHVGVEQERPPRQVEQQVGPAPHGAEQAADAQVTPRAHQVVHDLDGQAGLGRGKDVHGLILSGAAWRVTPICTKPCMSGGPCMTNMHTISTSQRYDCHRTRPRQRERGHDRS